MIKILFVCHGNICRSPMAEFIMKDLVKNAGLENQFVIRSAATSDEEIGNSVYPPAKRLITDHGMDCSEKTARKLRKGDYNTYDLLIGMDTANLLNMQNIFGGDPQGKLHLLLEYAERPGDIPDPWYTRDFEGAWDAIEKGCRGLLQKILENKIQLRGNGGPAQ